MLCKLAKSYGKYNRIARCHFTLPTRGDHCELINLCRLYCKFRFVAEKNTSFSWICSNWLTLCWCHGNIGSEPFFFFVNMGAKHLVVSSRFYIILHYAWLRQVFNFFAWLEGLHRGRGKCIVWTTGTLVKNRKWVLLKDVAEVYNFGIVTCC